MYVILDVIILISLGILDQCISKTLKSIIKVIEKNGKRYSETFKCFKNSCYEGER